MAGLFQCFIFSALFFLHACGDPQEGIKDLNAEQDPERLLVNYIPELQKDAGLSAIQASLYQEIQSAQEPSYRLLTEAFFEKHIDAYFQKNLNEFRERKILANFRKETLRYLKNLVHDIDFQDPHSFKVEWEAKVGKIEIDADAKNIINVFLGKKLQAYSGTSAQILLWRLKLSEEEFKKQNFVVVFERGHLLPGYLERAENDWNLFGLEMTTEGPSQVIYGPTKSLKSPIRIVSAEDFLLEEVFQEFFLHSDEVKTKLLKKSSQRFGILLDRCEPKAQTDGSRFFGKTLFCFGHPMIGSGSRKFLNQVEAGDFRPKNGLGFEEIRRLFVTDRRRF